MAIFAYALCSVGFIYVAHVQKMPVSILELSIEYIEFVTVNVLLLQKTSHASVKMTMQVSGHFLFTEYGHKQIPATEASAIKSTTHRVFWHPINFLHAFMKMDSFTKTALLNDYYRNRIIVPKISYVQQNLVRQTKQKPKLERSLLDIIGIDISNMLCVEEQSSAKSKNEINTMSIKDLIKQLTTEPRARSIDYDNGDYQDINFPKENLDLNNLDYEGYVENQIEQNPTESHQKSLAETHKNVSTDAKPNIK